MARVRCINLFYFVLKAKVHDKESVNTLERLWEFCQLQVLSMLWEAMIDDIIATCPQC